MYLYVYIMHFMASAKPSPRGLEPSEAFCHMQHVLCYHTVIANRKLQTLA